MAAIGNAQALCVNPMASATVMKRWDVPFLLFLYLSCCRDEKILLCSDLWKPVITTKNLFKSDTPRQKNESVFSSYLSIYHANIFIFFCRCFIAMQTWCDARLWIWMLTHPLIDDWLHIVRTVYLNNIYPMAYVNYRYYLLSINYLEQRGESNNGHMSCIRVTTCDCIFWPELKRWMLCTVEPGRIILIKL